VPVPKPQGTDVVASFERRDDAASVAGDVLLYARGRLRLGALHRRHRRTRRASGWSAVIILLSACTVVAYTTNRWMVVPAALGAYVGTFVAVRSEVTAS